MQPFKKSHWILLFATAVAINACNSQAATDRSPWLNTSLSIPERVDLLVAQMTLEEKIAPEAFATFTAAGKREILPGNFEISVGGGQPGMKVKTSSNILQTSVTIMK